MYEFYAHKNDASKIIDLSIVNIGKKDICIRTPDWPQHGAMDDCIAGRRLQILVGTQTIPYRERICTECASSFGMASADSCRFRIHHGQKLTGYLEYADFVEDITHVAASEITLDFPYSAYECD
jgi:hypothetical protein